jgi:hypothetical protein
MVLLNNFFENNKAWSIQLLGGVVGSGKSRMTLMQLAELHRQLEADGKTQPFIVYVPRHKLGEQFAEERPELSGLNKRVIYGRRAKDPRHAEAGKIDANWCHKPVQVKSAEDLSLSVEKTCCRSKDSIGREIKCQFYESCGFQQQFRDAEDVDVFIMAHNYLAHEHDKIPKPHHVFIDEDPIGTLVFELPKRNRNDEDDDGGEQHDAQFHMPLDTLLEKVESVDCLAADELNAMKATLHTLLLCQIKAEPIDKDTPQRAVKREFIAYNPDANREDLTAIECLHAHWHEFATMPQLDVNPSMSARQFEQYYKKHAAEFRQLRLQRTRILMWEALAELLLRYDDNVASGRVYLYRGAQGAICIGIRGVRKTAKRWRVTTVIADATMQPKLLELIFDDAKVVNDNAQDFAIALPDSVTVTQIINAPVSKNRLIETKTDINRAAIRCYVKEQALLLGRPKQVLVGCQLAYEKWLKEKSQPNLPDDIFHVRHFNDVAGEDQYGQYPFGVIIGRAAPGPDIVENFAAAISGDEPVRLKRGQWYPRVRIVGEVRLRDGGVADIFAVRHPDVLVEKVRQLKTEAGVLQMIGRLRPYNRTLQSPLALHVMADFPLPYPVELVDWSRDELTPLAMIEPMHDDGYILLSPQDMNALWPELWANEVAAKRELDQFRKDGKAAQRVKTILSRGWRSFRYQRPGARQKMRFGVYDPALHASAECLRNKIGPLAKLEEAGEYSQQKEEEDHE